MEDINSKLTDEEKIIFIIKELYKNAQTQEEKDKFRNILLSLVTEYDIEEEKNDKDENYKK